MKYLPLAVALAVAALTGLTIWVGALAREDTVVERPYEEGLRYGHEHDEDSAQAVDDHPEPACDLGAGPCTSVLGDLALTAELGPRPVAPMSSLSVTVELRRTGVPVDGAEVAASFVMAGMHMGDNVVALAPAGPGRYSGTAVLVRCPSGRRDWKTTVAVREGAVERRAELALRTAE
jgi:hypothetical protein